MWQILQAFSVQTFKEAIRNKILYGIGFFTLSIFAFSLVLGELSLYEQERVIKDIGIALLSLLGMSLALYMGIGMLQREIEEKTIYTILSKPVQRWQAVVGKFFGISLTLAAELSLMFVIFTLLLISRQFSIDLVLFQSFWLIYLASVVVAAVALMWSSFAGKVMSVILSVSIIILGLLYDQISFYLSHSDSQAMRALMRTSQFLLPNFSQFNISSAVTYGLDVSWKYVGLTTLQGLATAVVMLMIASVVFERRDFI